MTPMRHISIIALLTLMLLPDVSFAQDNSEGVIDGSLSQFIEAGLQNNYDLRIVRNEERQADNNATRANAGYLPTISANAGYDGSYYGSNTKARQDGIVTKAGNSLDHGLSAGINAEWTIFDGFKIQTNYRRLQELKRQSRTQTRIAIEDYVANLTAEYYNFVQQRIRMRNLRNAVKLSKERLRIVLERYTIGSASRLDLQQAQVDFNADSAQSLKQHELLATSRIKLYEMMAVKDIDSRIRVRDTSIVLDQSLVFDTLLNAMLRNNSSMLMASQNIRLAELDYKSTMSRDYPYVRLNGGYSVSHNNYGSGTAKSRDNWGANFGVTMGITLFDGKRNMQRRNARINVENSELAQMQLEQSLRADLADLWQAYKNNLRLLALERENLITAQENHYIAHERYMLGDLSGIEMREAQQSLLNAEERILVAEYNTKLCEISLRQLSGSIMRYTERL